MTHLSTALNKVRFSENGVYPCKVLSLLGVRHVGDADSEIPVGAARCLKDLALLIMARYRFYHDPSLYCPKQGKILGMWSVSMQGGLSLLGLRPVGDADSEIPVGAARCLKDLAVLIMARYRFYHDPSLYCPKQGKV